MNPDEALRVIGFLGALLVATVGIALTPISCDDPACKQSHNVHRDREKRKAATSRHTQHGAGFREALCAKCEPRP